MLFRRKRQDKSEGDGVSIILVPPHRSTRHWHIPTWVFRLVGVVTIVLLAGVLMFARHYNDIASDINELYRLRAIKQEQETRLRELDRLTEELAARLRYLEVTDERIRAFLDEEELLPPELQQVASSSEVQQAERMWSVQTATGGEEAPSFPRDPHQLASALAGMYERSCDTERSMENLYHTLTSAADYFRAQPSIWPVVGRVSSGYGMRRSPFTGQWAFHHGIDIAADYGTEIRATADGVVEFSGYNGLLGHCVILDHGYGVKTLYAHNWRNLVEAEDWVERGDTIALVGSSGRSTGPHLHYEVWVDGERVDPWDYHLSTSPTDHED